MPRKALVPARAALRFAQKAAGECGPAQPGRRGIRALAAAGGRVSSARHLRALMLVTQLHDLAGEVAGISGPHELLMEISTDACAQTVNRI